MYVDRLGSAELRNDGWMDGWIASWMDGLIDGEVGASANEDEEKNIRLVPECSRKVSTPFRPSFL